MPRKYRSPLTKELTPDNWQEKINLKQLSLDDMVDLLGDFRQMEKFAQKVGGFMKEATRARMPEGESQYQTRYFSLEINHRVRAGSLDAERIKEEMGEQWYLDHCKEPTEYDEIRLKPIEAQS